MLKSEILAAVLQEARADVMLDILPGAGHGGPEFHDQALSDMVKSFFMKHIR